MVTVLYDMDIRRLGEGLALLMYYSTMLVAFLFAGCLWFLALLTAGDLRFPYNVDAAAFLCALAQVHADGHAALHQ